jgi:type I restriction enzyme S subunit
MNVGLEGWATCSLEQLTSLIKDGTHGTHQDTADGVPFLSAKDVRDGALAIPDDCRRISENDYNLIHKNYSVAKGDILLTVVGTIGRCCQIIGTEPRFTIQRSVAVIRPSTITSNYLYHYCRSDPFQKRLKDFTNASAQGGVYLGSLAKCSVTYPSSTDEQTRIAEILSTVDRSIEETETLIAKQQRITTGLMQDVLTRGIDRDGNLRSERTHRFKKSSLAKIPEEWEVRPIGEVAEIIDPNPSHRYPPPSDTGVPIASTENFENDDDFDLRKCGLVPNSVFEEQYKRCRYERDDIVFARKGRLGFARPYGDEKKVFSHTVVLIKAKKSTETINEFLLWAVRDAGFFLEIDKRMNSNSGVPTLGIEFLAAIPIRVPKRDEQERIAQLLSKQAMVIAQERNSLHKLRRLKTALMQDLLTGRKRVTALLGAQREREKSYARV